MADREDVRQAVLVYANGDWEGVAFRDELERLERRMNLTVVHVLERPPTTWTGETGSAREMASCSLAISRAAIGASSSSSAGPGP
jgi:ferredoxin-NADP reductase